VQAGISRFERQQKQVFDQTSQRCIAHKDAGKKLKLYLQEIAPQNESSSGAPRAFAETAQTKRISLNTAFG
jgi:hypothetical protein